MFCDHSQPKKLPSFSFPSVIQAKATSNCRTRCKAGNNLLANSWKQKDIQKERIKTKNTKWQFHLFMIYSAHFSSLKGLSLLSSYVLDNQYRCYLRKCSTATFQRLWTEIFDVIFHQLLWKMLPRVKYWIHPSLTNTNRTTYRWFPIIVLFCLPALIFKLLTNSSDLPFTVKMVHLLYMEFRYLNSFDTFEHI